MGGAEARLAGPPGGEPPGPSPASTARVLRNPRFAALWLAQVASQIGGNMVLYALTILVFGLSGDSNAAVSLLILSFLVPAVVFSPLAGVYVDRFDRRLILVVSNVLRGLLFLAIWQIDRNLLLIFTLNMAISTITTFFAPAEAAMIPRLVDRGQLLAASSLFTVTLQASFALGFALLGPLLARVIGVDGLIVVVGVLYLVAAGLCATLPSARPEDGEEGFRPALALGEAERAAVTFVGQLRDGVRFIRANPSIGWSLTYQAVTASLIGVMGVLGPGFATQVLGLGEQDFVVVVLPLGVGLVLGILLLNVYGRFVSRRRVIEGGLMGLAAALVLLAVAPHVSGWLKGPASGNGLVDLGGLVSLLAIVVVIAIAGGICYAFVFVTAQTQLQEELPTDVRGRVFGVLNMLVNIASFLPIVIVGPIADAFGTTAVVIGCGVVVAAVGARSILVAPDLVSVAATPAHLGPAVDPVARSTLPLGMEEQVRVGIGQASAGGPKPGSAPTSPESSDAAGAPRKPASPHPHERGDARS